MDFRDKIPSVALSIRGAGILNTLISDVTLFTAADHTKNYNTKGIWDTGATNSVITQEVVNSLGLLQSGVTQVSTATISNQLKPTYLIDVRFPSGLVVNGVQVTVGTIAAERGISFLIGMDIIALGDFSITNKDGKTTMSFIFPSQNHVDYVQKIEARNSMVKRHLDANRAYNQKCICDSGKKFKNCHGSHLEPIGSAALTP